MAQNFGAIHFPDAVLRPHREFQVLERPGDALNRPMAELYNLQCDRLNWDKAL